MANLFFLSLLASLSSMVSSWTNKVFVSPLTFIYQPFMHSSTTNKK
jgi:hypothetical protein